jgi:hypothetical protein
MSTEERRCEETTAAAIDEDLREPSPSTGWRATFALMHADPDQAEAAARKDRPEQYRRKHVLGVTS